MSFARNPETFRADDALEMDEDLRVSKQRRSNGRARAAAHAATGASWLALVAATTLGSSAFSRLRAEVTADARKLEPSAEGYRLIVQSYAPGSLGDRNLPGVRARPLASTQRAVTREELARGVAVDVLGVSTTADSPLIVAWVERGKPNLDFDALEARPGDDAFYGAASANETVRATPVILNHRRSA